MRAARVRIGAIVALVILAPAFAAGAPAPLAVGDRAPDIVLSDQHGKPFTLADVLAQRRFVAVAFYVKAFTSGWQLEFSRFREDAARYAALDAEVVGISSDAPARNLAWARELRLPFRLLSDTDGRVGTSYGVWDDTWNLERRVTFIVDRAQRVRFVEVGGLAIETSRTLDALTKLAATR